MRSDADDLQELKRRSEQARRRFRMREPKRAADIMAAVLQRRGYGRVMENEQLAQRWKNAVEPRLAPFTRAVRVYRGRLEVLVTSSAVMQELTFAKQAILKQLSTDSEKSVIRDIRFRIGEAEAGPDSR